MKLFHVSYIAVWVLVLFQGFLALALLRYLGEVRDLMKQAWGGAAEEDFGEDDLLPAGVKAPGFTGFDARSGKTIGIRDLDGGGARCSFCHGNADCVEVWRKAWGDIL
jgi:hypothetical protein